MFSLFQNFDSFSVPLNLQTYQGQSLYKTALGGLTTIIIYTIGICYLAYILTLWQTNCILPKVTTQLVTQNQLTMKLSETFLTFGLFNSTNEEIDPFRETENILTPLVLQISGMKFLEPIPIFSELKEVQYDSQKKHVVSIGNLEIVQYSGNSTYQSYADLYRKTSNLIFVAIAPCQAKFLKQNQSCAKEEVIEEYLSKMQRIMDVNIEINQYNSKEGKFEKIIKTSYLVISRDLRLYSQVMLQTTQQTVDQGLLFESITYREFTSDFKLDTQIVTKEFSENYFGFDSVASFFLRIDDLQNIQNIAYPKLGEVLAQVGSLLSVLLSLQYAVQYLNKYLCLEHELQNLMTIYYPKIKNYEFNRNIFGKLVSIGSYPDDQQEFIKNYEYYKSQLEDKIKLSTILSDIFNLQKLTHIDIIQGRHESNQLTINEPHKIYPKQLSDSERSFNQPEKNINRIFSIY